MTHSKIAVSVRFPSCRGCQMWVGFPQRNFTSSDSITMTSFNKYLIFERPLHCRGIGKMRLVHLCPPRDERLPGFTRKLNNEAA